MTPVWWVLIFVPALIALYFLKLKRQDLAISSTYLWKRSMEDLHVNSPFQRLRQSLLFFLQLIALILLILAVWRPRCDREASGGRNFIVLVDRSASMNTKEVGGTRLELAKEHVLAMIDGMKAGDRLQVLTFSSRTTNLQPLTSDGALLATKVNAIEPTSLPTDLPQALLVAYSRAAKLDSVEVHVVGDSCYGEEIDVSPEVRRLDLRFVSTARDVENIGITEADVRRSFGRERVVELFALVENRSDRERAVVLSLFHGEELQRAADVIVGSNASAPIVFDVSDIETPDGESRVVRLELSSEDGLKDDGLSDDNIAYLTIPARKEISVVVVGAGNAFVENAVLHLPDTKTEKMSLAAYEEAVAEPKPGEERVKKTWGLVVFDRRGPKLPPESPALFIGCKPPLPDGIDAPREVERPVFMDMDYSHPVNRFMNFENINIASSWVYAAGPSFRPLVESEDGPIIGTFTYREEGEYPVRAIVIGFDILQSNWPINHHSFPIFFTNAVAWLGVGEDSSRSRWRTGESLVHSLDPGRSEEERTGFTFRDASGEDSTATVERSGSVVYGSADEIGVYELRQSDERVTEFPVSLLNHEESTRSPIGELKMGDISITAESSLEMETSELWRWFALAGFAFLLFEWYVYNRRVYV